MDAIMNRIVAKYPRFLVFIMMVFVSVQACKPAHKLIKAPLRSADEMYLLEKMAAAETKYAYFNAKTAITLIDEKKSKTELKGQIRIKKDSIIWISLSPALGIEAARLVLTADSIKFINRLDKTFFIGDYKFILQQFGTTIDYDMVQALITGNDLESYEDENLRASVDNMEYKLSATHRYKAKKNLKQKDTPNVLVQNIWLNAETFKIVGINMKEYNDENKKLQARYSDFFEVGNQKVPGLIHFELQGGKKLELKIVFNKTELDTEQQFPFKIPENFTKMK